MNTESVSFVVLCFSLFAAGFCVSGLIGNILREDPSIHIREAEIEGKILEAFGDPHARTIVVEFGKTSVLLREGEDITPEGIAKFQDVAE